MFMENNTGSRPVSASQSGSQAAPAASCPDSNGTLPSCAGLAVPYVPFQQNNPQKYAQSEALSNGTLFPGLNLPFHLAVEGSTLPATPLAELQAFKLFKQFSAMEKAAKAAYESKFGPITKETAATGDSYQWLSDPWPWNFAQNEVK